MNDAERTKLIERLRGHQCKREDCGQCKRDTLIADELARLSAIVDPLERLLPTAQSIVLAAQDGEYFARRSDRAWGTGHPDLAAALAAAERAGKEGA